MQLDIYKPVAGQNKLRRLRHNRTSMGRVEIKIAGSNDQVLAIRGFKNDNPARFEDAAGMADQFQERFQG
jgi:hypothetical protein